MSAFVPSSGLTVCIDFKSPHGWLAVAPTRALEDELGIVADWQPLVLAAPSRPPIAAPGDARGARHRHLRAQYYEADLRRYAALRGLPLGRASRADDSRWAALGLLWAKRAGHDVVRRYVDAVYGAYFTDGEPVALGDLDAIAAIVQAVGGDSAGFADDARGEGVTRLERLQAELAEAGLANSPAYLVGEEMFHGRAHLPMVRWLLQGRSGPMPI